MLFLRKRWYKSERRWRSFFTKNSSLSFWFRWANKVLQIKIKFVPDVLWKRIPTTYVQFVYKRKYGHFYVEIIGENILNAAFLETKIENKHTARPRAYSYFHGVPTYKKFAWIHNVNIKKAEVHAHFFENRKGNPIGLNIIEGDQIRHFGEGKGMGYVQCRKKQIFYA